MTKLRKNVTDNVISERTYTTLHETPIENINLSLEDPLQSLPEPRQVPKAVFVSNESPGIFIGVEGFLGLMRIAAS